MSTRCIPGMNDDVPELEHQTEDEQIELMEEQKRLNRMELYDADPKCQHHVVPQCKCTKCRGWFCI